jgi:hypothetical protein
MTHRAGIRFSLEFHIGLPEAYTYVPRPPGNAAYFRRPFPQLFIVGTATRERFARFTDGLLHTLWAASSI